MRYILNDQIVEDIISKVPLEKQAKCFREIARVFEMYADGIESGRVLASKEPDDPHFCWIDDDALLVTDVKGKVIGKI